MGSVNFSFGEGRTNCSYSGNGSILTPEQIRGFSMPSKAEVFKKSDCKKMLGPSLPTVQPNKRYTLYWLRL